MRRLGAAATLACMSLGWAAADPQLEAATLPDARSVAIGDPATVFATVMNRGDTDATNCFATTSYDDNSPTTLTYQTVDAGNALTGTINTPVTIPAGSQQGFLLAVTASEAFSGTIPFVFECDNASALGRPGINDLVLTVEAGSPPDLVTILATPSGDGVLRIPTAGGANAAGGAVINIGGGTANVTATPVLIGPEVNTQLTVDMCETNPATGVCLAPRSASVDMSVDGTISTFTVFVRADPDFGVPLYPEFVRVSVEFRDQVAADDGNGQPLRGASSVAYTAPPSFDPETALPLTGSYAFRIRDEDNDAGGRFQGDGVLAFDENGIGIGFMPTRFGDQVVLVQGTYDLADPDAPSFSGTFEYLQYIVVNFNTATGDLNFNYEVNSGFRGLYAFQRLEDQRGIDAPLSRSVFSDASRVMAMTRRGHSCDILLNGEDGVVYDAYLGGPPESGQAADFSITTLANKGSVTDPEINFSVAPGPGGYTITGSEFTQTSTSFFFTTPFRGGGSLVVPDGEGGSTTIVPDWTYIADCDENGFILVGVSGSVGYTIHFRKRQAEE